MYRDWEESQGYALALSKQWVLEKFDSLIIIIRCNWKLDIFEYFLILSLVSSIYIIDNWYIKWILKYTKTV